MKISSEKLPVLQPISLLSIFVLIIGWGSFLLALFGLFFQWTSYLLVAFPVSLAAYALMKKKITISRNDGWALSIALFFIIIFASFFQPAFFSGRDQGSIGEAAIRLADSHSVRSTSPSIQTFFEIYGPGKALNFPGFHYTNTGDLITQFPLPYIAYLAVFYDVFGLWGFILANSLLFLVSAMAIFSIALRFTNFKLAILTVLLLATTFIFSWISRMALSENLAMALLWLAILFLIKLWEKPSPRMLLLCLLTASLLFFTRIEGIIFFIIISLLAFRSRPIRKIIFDKKIRKKIVVLLLSFIFILILALRANNPAYREIGKAFISSDLFSSQPADDPTDTLWGSLIYQVKVFSLYELVGFLALGMAGIIWTAWKRKWPMMIPFLAVSPTFLYLCHSYISSDHPWMLRRFSFSVLPALILYSVFFLYHYQQPAGNSSSRDKSKIFRKIFLIVVVASLFISNLFIFSRFIFLQDNRGMIPQVEKISQKFSERDLVLVDRLATGDGWSMMTGPLDLFYDKQAVYFFNPKDFDKIKKERYENIYLVAPDENYEKWLADLNIKSPQIIDSYFLTASRMEITADPEYLPSAVAGTTKGKIIKLK